MMEIQHSLDMGISTTWRSPMDGENFVDIPTEIDENWGYTHFRKPPEMVVRENDDVTISMIYG